MLLLGDSFSNIFSFEAMGWGRIGRIRRVDAFRVQIRAVLQRFVSAVHRGGARKMVWIGPPDSSRFSKVQNRIYRLIQQSVWRSGPVIDSRRFTRYLVGKTGGDGVHYNRESGEAWARRVIDSIDHVLAADIAARRKVASNR